MVSQTEFESNKNVTPISGHRASKKNAPDAAADGVVRYGPDGRPATILHFHGQHPQIVDALAEAVAASSQNIFVCGKRIVEVIEHHKAEKNITRPQDAITLLTIGTPRMIEIGGRACKHERWDSRKNSWVPTDCPRRIAEAYLAREHWPELRDLIGFCEAPYITEDGRLVDLPGYDEETAIYMTLSPSLSSLNVPAKANRQDAKKAVEILTEHLNEFNFVQGADGSQSPDESGAIAAIMTALLRRVFPSAPGFAISATAAGTGKTTLAEVASIVATGRRPAVLSLGGDESETEKRLSGVLLSGDGTILLDNVERSIGGDLLCQVLTQPFVKVRPLGGSGILSIPTNATLFITGNSLSVIGDLKRRIILIRMDAGVETPETRHFKKNVIEGTMKKRGMLIGAALTITYAYMKAGAPTPEHWHPYGSFEMWDKLVRRALMWAGLPDPLLSSHALKDVDPDIEGMRMLFDAWLKAFELEPRTPRKVTEIISRANESGGGPEQLKDALNFVCSEKVTSKRLAGWLRTHRDRIMDGRRMVIAGHDSNTKVTLWKLEACG